MACKIKTFSNLRVENVCSPGEAKCRSVLAGRSEMLFCVCRIKSFVEAREVNESLKSLQSYTKSVENHLNNNTQRPHNRASSTCINFGNFDFYVKTASLSIFDTFTNHLEPPYFVFTCQDSLKIILCSVAVWVRIQESKKGNELSFWMHTRLKTNLPVWIWVILILYTYSYRRNSYLYEVG